ncbi:OTU domain-containing protein 3-like isoform X2 [Tubulanus polymorphus]|uniref:OTU domain-containing protein 3-like isoform X2 n=1 Tax=Tubulanus polymorphus TaxID=672921 RepID=UPI003DA4C776
MSSKRRGGETKSQRLDKMARKKEERAVRRAHQQNKTPINQSYLADDENYPSFSAQLAKLGLQLRDIPGDGNCLFRALDDQLEGHCRNHLKQRLETVQYMIDNRRDFEPFVEDDISFDRHIMLLKKPGTYAGNDAIVAFSRLLEVNIVIHQYLSPPWIQGTTDAKGRELHISYHNGDHYSSVRRIGDNTETPAYIKLKNPVDISENEKKKFAEHMYTNGYDHQDSVPSTNGILDDESTVELVMRESGCDNERLVRDLLEESDFDVDQTVAMLLEIMESSNLEPAPIPSKNDLWGQNGSGNRLFGSPIISSDVNKDRPPPPVGARPKQPKDKKILSNRLKKMDKKKRAMDRHRQRLSGEPVGSDDVGMDDSEDETTIVSGMGSLQI